uniref:H/ACA ribonucleoprotein complex non-core subunit NAF1 n=1 Tax=Strongyloides papillosus TaxID=174720 RepID=A0A0N5B3G5_STREA
MSIGELLKMPLKEVKHGIKAKKENGQSSSSISSSILYENISDSCNNSNNKSIKNQRKNSCTPVKVNSNGKIPESHEGETLSLVDSLLGDTNDDTTSKHLNHLYDSNCKICQDKKSKEERLIREREEAVAEREAKRKRREMEIEMRIREEKMNLLKREMEEKKKMEKNLYNVTLHDGSHNIPLTIYPIKNPDLFILKDEMPRRLKNINHVRNINALKEVFEISIDSLTSRVMVCIVEADGNVGDENFLKYRKYLFKERLGIVINFEDSNLLKSFSLIPLDSFADIPDLLFDLPGYEISLFDFSTKFVGVFILEDQKLLDIFTSPPKPPILKNITKTTDAKESGDKKCCDKDSIRQDDDDGNDSKVTEKIINDDFKCHSENNDQPSSTPTCNIDKNITSSSDWMPMVSDTPKNETVSSPEPIITTHVGFKIPSLEMSEPPVPPSIELKSNSNVDVQEEEEEQPSQGGGKANKRKRSRKNRKSRNNKKRTRENSNNQSHSKFSGLSNVRRDFRSPLGPYHPRPDRRPGHNYLHDNDNVRMVEDRYNHVQSIPYNGSPLYQHQPSPSSSSLNGGVYSPRNSIPSLPRYSFSTPPSYNSRPILPLLKQEPYIKPLMEQTIVLGPQFNQPSPPNPSMYSSRIPQGISGPQSMYGNNVHGGQQQQQRPPQNNYYHHQQSSGNSKHHHYQQPYYNNFSRSRRF